MATKTLAKLKTEVSFNRDLSHLVDVMKNIAAQQYHIMDRKKTEMPRYKRAVEELFGVYDFRASSHPFIRARSQKKLVVLVTTDFGFLGGLNMKVLGVGLKGHEKDNHYLVIGERGANTMREHDFDYTPFPGINPDETRYELVLKIQQEIFRRVLRGGYSWASLVFPHSTSMGSSKVQVLNLVPCPIFFKDRAELVLTPESQERFVILESEESGIIEALTESWMRQRLIECFESAKLAEYGARMMHLEDSYSTLSKIDKQLRLEFFKARREKIDQSLRETCTSQMIIRSQE